MAREFSSDAYDVHAVLRIETFGEKSYDFTALFTEEAGNWTMLAAVKGAFERAKLVPTPKGYAVDGELIPDDGPEGTFVMQLSTSNCMDLWVEKLEIIPEDHDGDGVVDHFAARADGVSSSENCLGNDIIYEEPFELELTGELDTTAPSLDAPESPLHPLLWTYFVANEPLSEPSTLTLQGPSTYQLTQHESDEETDFFWAFRVPPLTRFGATFDVIADGTDISGHPIPTLDSLTTLPDPGITPQDGFESDVPALSGVTLVEADPISGSRSLYVTYSPQVTLHLSRGEGTTLRFKARVAWQDEHDDIEDIDIFARVVARVAVVGGAEVFTRYLHGPTVNGIDGALEEVQEFEVPLDEPGEDVIISFEMEEDDIECGLAQCASAPALIDDLRIE